MIEDDYLMEKKKNKKQKVKIKRNFDFRWAGRVFGEFFRKFFQLIADVLEIHSGVFSSSLSRVKLLPRRLSTHSFQRPSCRPDSAYSIKVEASIEIKFGQLGKCESCPGYHEHQSRFTKSSQVLLLQ